MEVRRVNVKEIVKDIRNRMADYELMEKYRLSALGLQDALSKLVAMGVISRNDLELRAPSLADTAEIEDMRRARRNYVMFTLPICEAEDPSIQALVSDVSEKGVKLAGWACTEGERKRLCIKAEEFADIFPIEFEAVCRWSDQTGSDGTPAAGFEIVSISDEAMQEFQKLLDILSYGENPGVTAE